jgi:flagellar hook protein FlgE
MLGAIYIGLSGMDAFSQGLQTISNNVANLNTLGFKAATVSFEDVYNNGGSGGLTYTGSSSQSGGQGVKVAPPLTDFTQGTLQQSTGSLDLAIQGSGFLVLQSGTSTYYTRTGSFAVDTAGNISLQGTNNHLSVLSASGKPVVANVNADSTNPPAATTTVTLANNLSSTATTAAVSSVNVFDAQGNQEVWTLNLAPVSGSAGNWTVTVKDASGATVGTGNLTFNGSTIDPTTAKITISTTPTGGSPISVVLDFSSVTSFSSGTTSTLSASAVDGHAVGNLTGVTVDTNGLVQLAYTNNQTKSLGAVALADFRDPQQLQNIGNGLYINPANSQVRLLSSAANGIGTLVSKQLEQSNVNLTQEFGDLIIIQRGFQASSQVVSVSNDMLQHLFSMRGQG